MARTIIGSTWNRDNRNGINNNFEELYKNREFIDGKVTDYTNLINNSIEFYQKDVLTPIFEMGNFGQGVTPGGTNIDASTTRIRQIKGSFLKAGMTLSPKASDDYEYSLIFWTENGFDASSGWINFGVKHQLDKSRFTRIVVRQKDNATLSQSDVTAVNNLFGDINMRKIDVKPIEYSQGAIFTSGTINYNPNSPTMITDKPVYLSEGFEVGLHSYDKYNLNVVMFDAETGSNIGSTGRATRNAKIEQFCLCYISPQKIDGTPVTDEELREAEDLTYVSKTGSNATTVKSSILVTDDIEHDFTAFSEHSFGNAEAVSVQSSEIDTLFSSLASSSGGYVKKNSLGTSVNNKSIYEIELNALKIPSTQGVAQTKPKVIILGSVHGNEKTPAFALYNFVKLLTNHWKENKLVEFLRFNVDFKIIPLGNPDGFNSNSRRNANDVDINREMPEGWTKISGGSSNNGDTPLSQKEGNIIYDWIQSNKDATFGIDFHNSLYSESSKYACWAGSLDESRARAMQNVISKVGRDWQNKYPQFPQSGNHIFGDVRGSAGGTVSGQMTADGIPGITLEVLREVPWQTNPHLYDELATTIALELLVKTIKANIKTLV